MFKVNSTSGLRAFMVPHSMTYGQLQATLRELGCGTSSGVTYNDQACSLALSSQMSLKPRAQNGTEDIHKKRRIRATPGTDLLFFFRLTPGLAGWARNGAVMGKLGDVPQRLTQIHGIHGYRVSM